MQEMEYLVVNAEGDQNVVRALNDKTGEDPPWELHSIVPAGLKTYPSNPLAPRPGAATAVMCFLVVFHRPHQRNGEIEI